MDEHSGSPPETVTVRHERVRGNGSPGAVHTMGNECPENSCVYETLNALMEKMEKYFVVPVGGSLAGYHVCDVSRKFDQIKMDTMDFVNDLGEYLEFLECGRPKRLLEAYELRDQWAFEHKNVRWKTGPAGCADHRGGFTPEAGG